METYCTRPGCSHPQNSFPDLDKPAVLKKAEQRYCRTCGMPQILGGRYIPLRKLGQGGFGAAFLARDRYTPTLRLCALKQFQPPPGLSSKSLQLARDRFEREAIALEELGNKHPQIPDLYASFPVEAPDAAGAGKCEFFYLAQEFIDGETLELERDRRGAFDEAEVREVLEEILLVLQFVHQNDTIHRDIKPSNIMRSREGVLYLLDFGAVKQVTAGGPGSSTGIYSQGFAPPEQMQGATIYPSTDLYALAATCLTFATGRPVEDLYDSYNNQWVWRSRAQVSIQLADVLDRMLSPAPRERFRSAAAVLRALHEPVAAVPPGNKTAARPDLLSDLPMQELPKVPTNIPPDLMPELPSAAPLAGTPSPAPSIPTLQQPTCQQSPAPPIAAPPPAPPALASPQVARPDTVARSPARKPARRPPSAPRFSLLEVLVSAAFIGFEGAQLFLLLVRVLPLPPPFAIGLWGATMGGLLYTLYRRVIEKIDLPILAVLTFSISSAGILFIKSASPAVLLQVTIVSVLAGAAVTLLVTLFRLVYNLVYALMN
ncbi:serine/threonine protein kinase [Rubidibacter lacunae KORDI 51-2]|uniref:non-specific serine/threonine protein kinase n=1 Tax=Rubidibacter lacunae KORDI 51-2 TaxID=582515 RepID=U5DCJ3_9CHRO|nr:serine/threonine-protein kinase [Rubidibacter lacunae]ERN42248.1 serine/threonine protein kinase [Rubidibacter lacunae KORDI 51-2]